MPPPFFRATPSRPVLILLITVWSAALQAADSPTQEVPPAAPVVASNLQATTVALTGKRARLAERIRQVEATVNAAEASSELDAGAADEELDQLKTLDLLLMQQLATIEQNEDIAGQLRDAREELAALRKFGPQDPKPYAYTMLEDARDQLAAEASRQAATAGDLAGAQQLLEAARKSFNESEKGRRLAHEAVEKCRPHEYDELAEALRLAELDSDISQETVALRRIEIETKKLRKEVCELLQSVLKERIEHFAKDVKFTEQDLKSRLDRLTRYSQEMKKKLREAESRLLELDAQQSAADAEFAAQPPDAATASAAKEAFQLARRVLHEEITLIIQRRQEIDQFKYFWECRFAVVNGKASLAELKTWDESLRSFLERIHQAEHSLALRIDEIRLDQSTLKGRSRETAGQLDPLRKWSDMRAEHLQRLAELCETTRSHLKRSQRRCERFLEDLDERITPERKPDWVGPARESFLGFWNYELASVEDHPITVGKIVMGLVYLLMGILVARLVSRQLGRRVLPRLGLNDGASHAMQSIAFYTLCVLFALLALEVVNLPFAAFTFLGGAAAIGIGFGSQSILNNFISGLILLAEQPIRVGDLVEIDGQQGTVEHIGARSTRVKTASNHEIVFPNSKLLENRVTNLTLTNDLVQTAIGLSISPSLSVEQVRESLLQAAAWHPMVLDTPEPVVIFKEFSASAMSFELHFWIKLRSVMECRVIESEVRQSINSLFLGTDAATVSAASRAVVAGRLNVPARVTAEAVRRPLRAAG